MTRRSDQPLPNYIYQERHTDTTLTLLWVKKNSGNVHSVQTYFAGTAEGRAKAREDFKQYTPKDA